MGISCFNHSFDIFPIPYRKTPAPKQEGGFFFLPFSQFSLEVVFIIPAIS